MVVLANGLLELGGRYADVRRSSDRLPTCLTRHGMHYLGNVLFERDAGLSDRLGQIAEWSVHQVLHGSDLDLQQGAERRLPSRDVVTDLQLSLTRGAELEENRVGLRGHCGETGVELIAQLANAPDGFYLVFLQ